MIIRPDSDSPAVEHPDLSRADSLYRQGKWRQALALYRQITARHPGLPDAWSRMGLIHLQQQQWESAIVSYRQALSRDHNQAAHWYNLAHALEETGKLQEAATAYAHAVDLEPDYPQALHNWGRLHLLQGDCQKAVRILKRCVRTAPDYAPAHNNLGQALAKMNALDEAIGCYERCGELDPQCGEAWFNLAEIHVRKNDPDKAIHYYKKTIAVQSDPSAAYNNMGNLYKDQGDHRRAAECYRKVVGLHPNLAEGHYNFGSAMRLLEEYEKALKHLALAVKIRPDYAQAWNNLALTCKNIGDLDRALTCLNRAVECEPDLAVTRWNRAFIHFLKEDYLSGWNDFEWRFKTPHWKSLYHLRPTRPRWDGRPYPNATILVHDEQGLGDTLQFVRYLPLVKERCARTILETRPELISLLMSAAGIDETVARPKKETQQASCDFHIPLMSLPGLFRTLPETIPGTVPYLHADRNKARDWGLRLPCDGLRIGLVWAGRPQHTNDHNRSCRLADLLPLLTLTNVRFIALQKGPAAEQIKKMPAGLPITDVGERLHDFSDTAAVMSNLDLVISVDTAAAHLAGAMGKPVWVLIPFIADWRWGARRQDSPWYPHMRLFRQPRPKDWPAVIHTVRSRLLQRMRASAVRKHRILHPQGI